MALFQKMLISSQKSERLTLRDDDILIYTEYLCNYTYKD